MSKKKALNKFDSLVERLIAEFVKIPNFNLLSEDEVGKKAFNIITFRITEVKAYGDLVCHHFIPATNKAIFDSKNDFNNSRYKHLLNNHELDFKETLYDTVRLAYVGLFHKFENFIKDAVKLPEIIFEDLRGTNFSVEKYGKEKFDFDLKDWRMFYPIQRINWICNCVKHYDGLPIKEPILLGFTYADKTKKMRIEPEEFKKDCEILIKLYPLYLQVILVLGVLKVYSEPKPLFPDLPSTEEANNKYREQISELENKLRTLLNNLSNLNK